MRLPGRLLLATLALAGWVHAQEVAPVPTSGRTLPPTPTDDEAAKAPLVVEQRAERVTYAVGARSPAAPSLGGPTGAAIAGAAGGAWHEDAVVIQSGPSEDARLVVTVEKAGKATTFDIRADQLVAFVGLDGLSSDAFRPRAVYAEGHVRVVIEAPQGQLLVEAEAAWFDLSRARAVLRDAEVRGERRAAADAPRPRPGDLSQATFVLRAERLRALGLDRAVAEGVTIAPCDLGEPHVALTAERLEATAARAPAPRLVGRDADPADVATPAPRPLPSGPPAPGRVKREAPAGWTGDAPLLDALLSRDPAQRGSDALRREGQVPRWVDLDGVGMAFVPPVGDGPRLELPLLPFASWRTDWPVPKVRVGQSSRFGVFATAEVGHGLGRHELPLVGQLELEARERVEHYQRRGTGGELGLSWRRTVGRERRGTGFLRAFGIDDRADTDRVGSVIETEHRYWLRGLVSERLPGSVQVDAEVSKRSDRGVLLEYFRRVAQTEKPQETYLYGRWSKDALSVRGIARFRLDDFQTYVEQLPEAKLDLVLQPIVVDEALGGVYLDLAARAGVLRRRPDDDLGSRSWEAGRADVDGTLSWRRSFGPLEARTYAGARETGWTSRLGPLGDSESPAIDRFAARAGWNVATTLWRTYRAPWGGTLRHELVPEVGTRHVFGVTRQPSELLAFDEVEDVRPTDHAFLRLRTRLLTNVGGQRRKLLDAQVEARYFLTDRALERGRTWSQLAWDVRLDPARWLSLRWRGELDPNTATVLAFDASASGRLGDDLTVSTSYRDVPGLVQAVSWSVDWQVTPAWTFGVAQQYDFLSEDFLAHRARVLRRFHCVAVEVSVVYNPLQDDVSASAAVVLTPFGEDGPFEGDRERELY